MRSEGLDRILAEGLVRGTAVGIHRRRAGRGSDVGKAGRAAGIRNGEIRRVTNRVVLIMEVHLVVDGELLVECADDAARAPVIGRAQAQFLAVVARGVAFLPGRAG